MPTRPSSIAASAISEKYANIGETTLTKTFKGDVFNTNLIISMVTGVVSTAVYSAGASSFDSLKLTAALWLLSTLVKFKDSGFDVSTPLHREPESRRFPASPAQPVTVDLSHLSAEPWPLRGCWRFHSAVDPVCELAKPRAHVVGRQAPGKILAERER